MRNIRTYEAIATMIGAIVGAGVLGIPYVVAKAGLLTGLADLIVIGLIVMLVYLYLGEVVLRTKGRHQLTGYAEKYLGKWGKRLMFFSMVFGIYGALTAYLIGEGQALSAMLTGNPLTYTLLFFVLVAALIYFGLEVIEKSELLMGFLILVIVTAIALFTTPHIRTANISSFNLSKIFLPYGVIFFAYLGMISVPEVSEILGHNRKKMKKVIIIGATIPIVLYLLFTFVVAGAVSLEHFESLEPNERIATIALGSVIGKNLFIFTNLFAVFAMLTSFLALGLALKEMFMYDYDMTGTTAWALTCMVPLVIALSGFTDFIQSIGIAGVIAGGIAGILVILMLYKAKKTGNRDPEYTIRTNRLLSLVLILVFIIGAVTYFVY